MDEPAWLATLNSEQRRAVVHSGAPLLILAGAGSGKTRVITTKIAYLVGSLGVSPRSILAVTFTNKAAGEMKERVRALVPQAEEVMVRTFHAFGAWFLRVNAALAGLDRNFLIADQDDSISLLKAVLGDDGGSDRGEPRRLYEEISRVKDLGITDDASTRGHRRGGLLPGPLPRLPGPAAGNGQRRFRRPHPPAPEAAARQRGGARAHPPALLGHPRGRVPGLQHRAVRAAAGPGRALHVPLRGGRRRPVHLQVPRRRGGEHPLLPEGVPRHRRSSAWSRTTARPSPSSTWPRPW